MSAYYHITNKGNTDFMEKCEELYGERSALTILFKKGISRHIYIENNSDPTRDYFKLYISNCYPLCIKYSTHDDSYVKMCLHPFEFKYK